MRAAALAAVALGCAGAWAQPGAARIELPARGLFDFTEGTIEAWVMLEFDPRGWQEDRGVYQWRGRWFTFQAPATETDLGAEVVIEYGLKNHGRLGRIEPGCNWRTAFYVDGEKVPHPLLPACTDLEPGTWHHFALTWTGAQVVRAYIDGELAQEMEFPWAIARDVPGAARIVIGHPQISGFNFIAIDDLRISSVARRPEDLGFAHTPLTPDPYTLLLLDFEDIEQADGQMLVRPAVMALADGPERLPVAGGRLIDGRTGRGLAMNTAVPEYQAGEAQ